MGIKLSRGIAATLAASLALAGCASSSSSIQPTYVSSLPYEKLSCAEVNSELARVTNKMRDVIKKQDNAATADAVATTVGVVVFLPALLVLAATDDERELVASLKGEYEALRSAAVKKGCPPLPEVEAEEQEKAKKKQEQIDRVVNS